MIGTTTGGLPLDVSGLQQPPTHIPDMQGGCFKTEAVLFRSQEQTHKIIWWHAEDPRQEPHNHPWEFTSVIISGGYTEERYWVDEHGEVQHETKSYVAGETNHVPANVFHFVHSILPLTVTKLSCTEAAPDNEWGYLDIRTGEYTRAEADPEFRKAMVAINPHLA